MAWRDLYRYWREHHVGDRPPSRREIDPPVEVPHMVPNLMMYRIEPDGFRLTLAGSEITKRAGKDLTGQLIDPDRSQIMNVKVFHEALSRVAETGNPVLFSIGRNPESAYGAIGLLLPLTRPSGQVEVILGGVFYEPTPGLGMIEGWRPGDINMLDLEAELAQGSPVRYGR